MTYWYKFVCEDCKLKNDGVFVIFNDKISLYPLQDKDKELAAAFLQYHDGHKVVVQKDE